MKILGLNANKKGRGTYYRTLYFMREFAKRGHSVAMFTVANDLKWTSRKSIVKGVKIIEGPNFFYHFFASGWNVLDIVMRMRNIMDEDYDLIYGTEYQPVVSFPIYLTKKRKKYKYISDWCDWHSGASNKFRNIKLAHKIDAFLEERIRFKADAVVVNNKSLEQRALSVGLPREKVFLIRDGDDTEYMKPYPKTEQRRKFNIPINSYVIATVYEGNDPRVTDVFDKVLEQMPNTYLMLIGKRNQGAIDRAQELGIYNKVIETGYVTDEDLPKHLSCSDVCFVVLSNTLCNRSRYPLKVSNYLSVGKATVTNNVGDIAGLFKKKDIGLLATSDFDVEDFAKKIISLLKNDGLREQYGENARKLMVEECDWSKTIGNHIDSLMGYLFNEKTETF